MTGNRHLQVGRTSVAFITMLSAVSTLGSKGSPEEPCVCGLPSAQLSTPLLLHRTGTGCIYTLIFSTVILVLFIDNVHSTKFLVLVAVLVQLVLCW